jgi:hypothetical protein
MKPSWGRKPNKNFLNIDRPKTKHKILLYSFTKKSSAPLNQEIPRHRPRYLLDVTPSCCSNYNIITNLMRTVTSKQEL